jgi:hypothetical protein
MNKYSFRWRSKAFEVFDLENPTQKVDIKANDLGEAWSIWFEKHLDKNQMGSLNQVEIIQFKS